MQECEEQVEQEVKEEPKAPSIISVDQEKQIIVARDQTELYRMIQLFMKGTAFPKTIDTPQKAIAAWQVAASLGLPPMVTIQNLAFIHGSVSMWGQLPKALAERTGQLEDFKLIRFDKEQRVVSLENKNLNADIYGTVVQIRRSKRSMNEYWFTEDDAKKAGLHSKSGPWQQYKKIMYDRRAMGHAIKFEFPDALMGVPVAEYDFNTAPDMKDVTPNRAKELSEALERRANGEVDSKEEPQAAEPSKE